ncbi:MAG: hypothetical protein II661_00560, partial [Bacteroidales bacterium]|nr:hypothetical protein [Bacteroidales bacterium]
MPTRFGKSLLSTSLSTWLLTKVSPRYRILRASYAADLAESFSQAKAENREFSIETNIPSADKFAEDVERWSQAEDSQF